MTLFIILYSKNNNIIRIRWFVAVFCSLLFLVVQHNTQHQNHTMSYTIECSYIHMFTALNTGHVLLGGCEF